MKLKQLAEDLIAANRATIAVARRHPDVFHPNVIVSRKAEDRVYHAVIRLIAKQGPSEAPV